MTNNDLFQQIISGNYISPDSGEKLTEFFPKALVAKVKVDILPLLAEIGHEDLAQSLIICDNNSYRLLGQFLHDRLKCKIIILDNLIKPDLEHINKIVEKIKIDGQKLVIAIGSGTISDIAKYSSFMAGISYIIIPTAPSMNGYASRAASIIAKGFRTSKLAHIPKLIILDKEILATAPLRLIQSGVGDSLCRATAQVDWFFSHLIIGTPYLEAPFAMLYNYEQELLQNLVKLKNRDEDSLILLMKILLISGFGMSISGGSYPASGGEHMLAHTIEMVYGGKLEHKFHGEQIAVTSLIMAKIQNEQEQKSWYKSLYETNRGALIVPEREILEFFGEKIGKECLAAYKIKQDLLKLKRNSSENFRSEFVILEKQIKEQISKKNISAEKLKEYLEIMGCPTDFKDLGLSESQANLVVKYAKYSRDRLTFLDLLA